MSSLRSKIAKMKGLPVRCVEMECHSVPMLALCPWQAKEWSLPWSRLEAVSFCHEAELERIDLFFPHHHVIAHGENLREILDEIRAFEVLCLRSLPPSHRASFEPREVFIGQLEVRQLADAKLQPAQGVLF